MITKNDLKQIVMLTYLKDPMLDNLAKITDLLRYDRDEIIFSEDEPADRFYMLKSGHILMEQRISDEATAILGAIKPGYSFGWSAMLKEGSYSVSTVCKEPSEAFSFRRDKFEKLIENDPDMGRRMYERILVIIKKRLDMRTEQFRKAIKNHPDMQSLFR